MKKINKTIFITGVTGFIGQHIARYFQILGYEVLGCARSKHYTLVGTEIAYHRWDITDFAAAPVLHIEPDFVVHCAGWVNDWGSYDHMYDANVNGTLNVIRAFPNSKIIHISTASVYDPSLYKSDVREAITKPQHYLSDYQSTKWEAEQIVINNAHNYIILRPHIVYGPNDTTIFPRLLKASKKQINRFLVLGDGKNSISLTYIENLALSIDLAINSEVTNEIFNIADEENGSVTEILDVFQHAIGVNQKYIYINKHVAYFVGFLSLWIFTLLGIKRQPLITPYIVAQMTQEYTLSIQKIKTALGYNSQLTYKKALQLSYGCNN